MTPKELLSWLFWRVGPIALVVVALRSGFIDYQKYVRLIRGETKTPSQIHLEAVADLLVEGYKKDRMLPEGYRLGLWLTQNPEAVKQLGPRPDRDPFGGSLRVTRINDGFILISDGPDRKQNTPDDLSIKIEHLERRALE